MYHDYETNLYTFPAIPLPPMAPEVTDWSEHHMKLSWKEPIDDGGAAVTGYHVEAKSRYAHSRRSHVTKYVHNKFVLDNPHNFWHQENRHCFIANSRKVPPLE